MFIARFRHERFRQHVFNLDLSQSVTTLSFRNTNAVRTSSMDTVDDIDMNMRVPSFERGEECAVVL